MTEKELKRTAYYAVQIRKHLSDLKHEMEGEYIEAVESNLSGQDKALDILGRLNEMQSHLSMVEIQLSTL